MIFFEHGGQNIFANIDSHFYLEGGVYLNQEKVPQEKFLKEIKKRLSSQTKVVISADKEVEYGAFVTIMDTLKANGINDVSLEYE